MDEYNLDFITFDNNFDDSGSNINDNMNKSDDTNDIRNIMGGHTSSDIIGGYSEESSRVIEIRGGSDDDKKLVVVGEKVKKFMLNCLADNNNLEEFEKLEIIVHKSKLSELLDDEINELLQLISDKDLKSISDLSKESKNIKIKLKKIPASYGRVKYDKPETVYEFLCDIVNKCKSDISMKQPAGFEISSKDPHDLAKVAMQIEEYYADLVEQIQKLKKDIDESSNNSGDSSNDKEESDDNKEKDGSDKTEKYTDKDKDNKEEQSNDE